MSTQKTMWDVISEYGRIGVGGLIVLMFVVWLIVHYQAEPGKEITFGFITYTKSPTTVSILGSSIKELISSFSSIGIGVEVHESCGNITFTGVRNTKVTVNINNATSRPGENWVFIFSDREKNAQLDTLLLDDANKIKALSSFSNLKELCRSAR